MKNDVSLSDVVKFSKSVKNHKIALDKIEECIDFCIDDYDETKNETMFEVAKKLHGIKELLEVKNE